MKVLSARYTQAFVRLCGEWLEGARRSIHVDIPLANDEATLTAAAPEVSDLSRGE
jgi:hypothetical protein